MDDLRRWLRAEWDRVAAVVAGVIGLVSLLLGWLGVADATLATEQIPYVASGGLLGIFLLGVAGVLWLSADLRDEWRELHRIDERLGDDDELRERLHELESRLAELEGSPENGKRTSATRRRKPTRSP